MPGGGPRFARVRRGSTSQAERLLATFAAVIVGVHRRFHIPAFAVVRLLCCAVGVSACGATPTAPTPVITDPCIPQTVQCLLDSATVTLHVNNALVNVGSTNTVTVGQTFNLRVDYARTAAQTLWAGFLYVRDDGAERLNSCFGLGGSGPGNGGFSSGSTISSNDAVLTRGHTVKVFVVAMFGNQPSEGCALRTATGALNHAAVQAQVQLLTLVVE